MKWGKFTVLCKARCQLKLAHVPLLSKKVEIEFNIKTRHFRNGSFCKPNNLVINFIVIAN